MSFRSLFAATVALICISQAPAQAKVTYDLSEFSRSQTIAGISTVRVDDQTLLKLAISPDLKFRSVELGLDVNLYLGDAVPKEFNSVVFRRFKYDHDEKAGIEIGRLQHVTLGQGLLMNNYDSGSFGSYEFFNQKVGYRGYIDYSPIRVEALYTSSRVLGTRLVYSVKDVFLGAPLSFGATFVRDKNGINTQDEAGVAIVRPAQDAWSADISMPIGGKYLTLYTEYAELLDTDQENSGLNLNSVEGKAGSAGFRGTLFKIFNYRAEYRALGSGFIPSYFDQNYEATSLTDDPAPNGQVKGYLISSGFDLGKTFKVNATYEDYEQADPIFSAAAGWSNLFGVTGVVNYAESFGGNDSAVLSADLILNSTDAVSYMVRYKKLYHPDGQESDSYSFGVQTNLNNFFKFPFSSN